MSIQHVTKTLGSMVGVALALAAPLRDASAADAPAKVVRVGFVSVPATRPSGGPIPGLVKELVKFGYVEGKNLIVEYRPKEAAVELAKLNVDVIVAMTNPAAFAAQSATRSIPIVAFAMHGALETGLVSSLRRPGGNLTGTESLAPELDAKRIELLKQIVPGLKRVAVLYDASDQGSPVHLKSTLAAGQILGVAVSTLEVRRAEDFEPVFSASAGKPLGGLLTYTSVLTFGNWKRVNDFATANQLPTLCEFRELAQAGCLLSYGPSFAEFTQRAAAQIDKILKGTPPGEIPVEQMMRFELVINLKTAKALGITIPQAVRIRADDVIE